MPLLLSPSTPAATGPLWIELQGVVPDRLDGLSTADIARVAVRADGRPCALGDLFTVTGDAADGRIECHGDFSRVHRLGAGMKWGEMLVLHSVGRHAAEGMEGGTLTIRGDAGDWLAAAMSGGFVLVAGNAGDNVGGSLPGENHGVCGGVVVVNGDAGCLAGARMRRGLIGVGGSCGEGAAFEMRAGTLVVAGSVGPRPGAGMRRGTVVALSSTPEPPPAFVRGAAWTPDILPLLGGRLARAGFRPAAGQTVASWAGVWQQWHGDLLAGGRGEIFHRLAGGF